MLKRQNFISFEKLFETRKIINSIEIIGLDMIVGKKS